jgi:hypothetical protein
LIIPMAMPQSSLGCELTITACEGVLKKSDPIPHKRQQSGGQDPMGVGPKGSTDQKKQPSEIAPS